MSRRSPKRIRKIVWESKPLGMGIEIEFIDHYTGEKVWIIRQDGQRVDARLSRGAAKLLAKALGNSQELELKYG